MVLMLWLRDELFDHGVVHTHHRHTRRLSRTNVDAVLTSLRAADATSVRFDAFAEAAKTHLNWTHEEAVLCFELFFLFHPESRTAVGRAVLPFLEFALFLFVQLYVPVVASSPVRQLAHTLWPSPEGAPAGSPGHGGVGTGAGVGVATSPSSHAHAMSHPHLHLSTTGAGVAPSPPSMSAAAPASPSTHGPGGHPATGAGHTHGLRSPISPSSPRGLALNTRATEQAHRLQFVKKHIVDILRIIYYGSDPEAVASAFGGGVAAAPIKLTRAALGALSFLVECGSTSHTKAANLADVSPWFARDGIGPALDEAPVNPRVLSDWLSGRLTVNEVLHPAVAQLPVPLPHAGGTAPASTIVPLMSCPRASCSREYESVKVADVAEVPEGEAAVTRPLLVSGIHRATAILAPEVAADAPLPAVRMDHCWDSYIYITAPVSFATIVGCSHCTIVIGAVKGGVLVEHCEGLRVVAAASVVRVSNSVDCTLFVHTPARPLIAGDCRGLHFAPHSAPYVGLRAHMERCGLSGAGAGAGAGGGSATSQWNNPLVLSTIQGGVSSPIGESKADDSRWFKLLDPSSFAVVTVPSLARPGTPDTSGAAGAGAGAGAPAAVAEALPLPPPYDDAAAERSEAVRALRRSIRDVSLSSDQKDDLQAAVQAHFREWLLTSGNIRQVTDLVKLHRDEGKDGRKPSLSLSSGSSGSPISSAAAVLGRRRRSGDSGSMSPSTPPPRRLSTSTVGQRSSSASGVFPNAAHVSRRPLQPEPGRLPEPPLLIQLHCCSGYK